MNHTANLIAPLLIPLATAVCTLLLWRWRIAQRWVSVAGATGLLAAAVLLLASVSENGIHATQIAHWPAPFGITIVADLFGSIMVFMAGLMGFVVAIYSMVSIDAERESFGYHPLFHLLLAGVCGAFLTGDMFNLYVWFEVMLMASFVLLALGGQRAQLEGSIKYVTINLVSSAFFLAGVGILYGLTGTLNMADAAVQLSATEQNAIPTVLAMFFLVSFGIKAAIFPLFFWLPASYHTPPVAMSAIFAALLTKVGVYALIRVFTLMFVHDVPHTHTIILVVSGFTMVTGVLGAAAQNEFRRILSFHIVSQIGYMIMGLALFTPMALGAAVYYIVHNILAKTNLFLISGVVARLRGTYELGSLGGVYRTFPLLAFFFLVSAFALAGVPPSPGFWGKLWLVKAGLALEQYVIVSVALVVSMLTLYSMTKIWAEVFWKKLPEAKAAAVEHEARSLSQQTRFGYFIPIALVTGIILAVGLVAEPFLALAMRTGEELMNPSLYIEAVLGRVR